MFKFYLSERLSTNAHFNIREGRLDTQIYDKRGLLPSVRWKHMTFID